MTMNNKLKQRKCIEMELDEIFKNLEQDHLIRKDLLSLPSLRRFNFNNDNMAKFKFLSFHSLNGPVKILIFSIFFWYLLKSLDIFNPLNVWRSYKENRKCLVLLPNSWQNALVPPNDCEFCRNITKIDRLNSLDPEIFSQKYAYTKIPVVITDAMVNWTAPFVFNFNYFKQLYLNESITSFRRQRKNCQFFPYKTEFRSLKEVFQMDESRSNYTKGTKPWYIGWSNCDYHIANKLRSHYSKPYFLPKDSESIRTDWIFMGTPDNGAHMHEQEEEKIENLLPIYWPIIGHSYKIDHVGRPSWQAQLHGIKRWFLEPPLECYLECRDLSVDVKQGDIIVLDTNVWYHKTLIIGNEISITIGAEYD